MSRPGDARHTVALSSAIHDIKTLVLSFHPVIAIESAEEERVERLVDAVGRELAMPVFEWTLTHGLVRRGEARHNRATADPAALLGHLRGLTVEGIFLLKDLGRHLGDPALSRLFKDLARSHARTRSALILTGVSHEFPPDLDAEIVHLNQVAASFAYWVRVINGLGIRLGDESIGKYGDATGG